MNDDHQQPAGTLVDPPTAAAVRFERLAAVWQADTAHLSSARDVASHPAYQQIIGMGPAAVPLILRELEREPNHWFVALRAITGADPVAPDDRGRIDRMARAWLDWGRQHGHRW